MKHFSSFHWLWGACCVLTLVGCQADVDMNKLDLSAKVSTDVALPLGTVTATLGDFLGDTAISGLHVDEKQQYYFETSATVTKEFHGFDISTFVGSAKQSLDFYEKIREVYPQVELLGFIPAGINVPAITFDLPISFKGLNEDVTKERLDSIILSSAYFASTITQQNIDFLWSEIDSATLILSTNFRGVPNPIEIPIAQGGFGVPIELHFQDFNLCFMKDPSKDPGPDNVLREVNMQLRLKLSTKVQHTLKEGATIVYGAKVDRLEYKAIFGYFSPSRYMYDNVDTALVDLYPDFKALQNFLLPVRKPEINIDIHHTMAMPLDILMNELTFTQLNPLQKRSATFRDAQGKTSLSKHFYAKNTIPLDGPLEATNTANIKLDYTPENGHIDTIFGIKLDRVKYDFAVTTDTIQKEQKQFRITNSSNIKLDVRIKAPFDFNPGVSLSFDYRLDSLNITEMDIDSLLKQAQIIPDAEQTYLALHLDVINAIPFELGCKMQFLDAQGKDIPSLSGEQTFPAPTRIEDGIVITPSEKKIELPMSYAAMKDLPKTKTILIRFTLGKNTAPAILKTTNSLSFKIGLSAHVKAQVNVEDL